MPSDASATPAVEGVLVPPICMSIVGGFRVDPFLGVSKRPLERFLHARLRLRDADELGCVYAYPGIVRPPVPVRGLVQAYLRANDAGLGATVPHRPDLIAVLELAWAGDELLDLGDVEWCLRRAYGSLFDVAEYQVTEWSEPRGPRRAPWMHRVEVTAAGGQPRGTPAPESPRVDCELDVLIEPSAAETAVAALRASAARALHAIDVTATPLGDDVRLAARWESRSVLELGLHFREVSASVGRRVRVLRHRITGDLLGDGGRTTVERDPASRAGPAAWHVLLADRSDPRELRYWRAFSPRR